jgi:hypothetical protein
MNTQLFESILRENKNHIIKKMLHLTDEEQKKLIDFFNKYPNLTNKVNQYVWQKPELARWEDFVVAFNSADNSRTAKKQRIKNDLSKMFDNLKDDVKIWFYDDQIIFVSPLKHKAAYFMDSFDCYGTGAQWCIGSESPNYWEDYINEDNSFVMLYHKKDNAKYMFQYDSKNDRTVVWNAKDVVISSPDWYSGFTMCNITDYYEHESIKKMIKQLPEVFLDVAINLKNELKEIREKELKIAVKKFITKPLENNEPLEIFGLFFELLNVFNNNDDDIYNEYNIIFEDLLQTAREIYNEKQSIPENLELGLITLIIIKDNGFIMSNIYQIKSIINNRDIKYRTAKIALYKLIKVEF